MRVFKKSSFVAKGVNQPSRLKSKLENNKNKNLKPVKPVTNKTADFLLTKRLTILTHFPNTLAVPLQRLAFALSIEMA